MLSAVKMIVLSLLIKLIAHHGLLSFHLDTMACEDVEDKEVAMWVIDESLP